MARPTGIEPKTEKRDEALEEMKVVDLFELRKSDDKKSVPEISQKCPLNPKSRNGYGLKS